MSNNFENTIQSWKIILSGRKAHKRKRVRKGEAEIVVDRLENPEKIQIEDPSAPCKIVYQLRLRSKVPRKSERCQGNCGVKLWPVDESNNEMMGGWDRWGWLIYIRVWVGGQGVVISFSLVLLYLFCHVLSPFI